MLGPSAEAAEFNDVSYSRGGPATTRRREAEIKQDGARRESSRLGGTGADQTSY